MRRCFVFLGMSLLPLSMWTTLQAGEKSPADRGKDAIIKNSMNPPVWFTKAYDDVWKQWGVAEKPKNYEEAFNERYGLLKAPFDNNGLPMGLMHSRGLLGKGIVNNCLLCHAGSIAGQTIIGVPNASLDLQGLFEELTQANGLVFKPPTPFANVRGTVDPVNPLTFLMGFRDVELNVKPQSVLSSFTPNVSSDPPAWWLLKKKKTRDWTGSIDARSTRVDMVNLLTPLNSGDYVRKHEGTFADISAFLATIEAPKYPFAIDQKLAQQGKTVFVDHCARCHGTYGPGGSYPNKIVPHDQLGTDKTLFEALRPELTEYFNKSWFAREIGPEGQPFKILDSEGYQAPPLDGVWATAPYFHNSSAPTIYHVINSKARPKIFTRSYKTGPEEYDTAKLGWKVTELSAPADPKLPGVQKRRIYDSNLPGQSNAGHTFGDKLTEEQRTTLLEYLKTL